METFFIPVVPFLIPLAYYLSKRLGTRFLPNTEYKGSYIYQSIISITTILFLASFYFIVINLIETCATYHTTSGREYYYCGHHELNNAYKDIATPLVVIIFIVELLVRIIPYRNNLIYVLLNTLLLSFFALFIAYVVDNFTIGIL